MANDEHDDDTGQFASKPRGRSKGGGRTRYDTESVMADPIDRVGSVKSSARVIAVMGLIGIVAVGVAAAMSWRPNLGLSFGPVPGGGDGDDDGDGDGDGDGGDGGEQSEDDAPEGGDSEEGGDQGGGDGDGDGGGDGEEDGGEPEGQQGGDGEGGDGGGDGEDESEEDSGGGGDGDGNIPDCPAFDISETTQSDVISYLTPLMTSGILVPDTWAQGLDLSRGLREYYADAGFYKAAEVAGALLDVKFSGWESGECVVSERARQLRDAVRAKFDEVNHV